MTSDLTQSSYLKGAEKQPAAARACVLWLLQAIPATTGGVIAVLLRAMLVAET